VSRRGDYNRFWKRPDGDGDRTTDCEGVTVPSKQPKVGDHIHISMTQLLKSGFKIGHLSRVTRCYNHVAPPRTSVFTPRKEVTQANEVGHFVLCSGIKTPPTRTSPDPPSEIEYTCQFLNGSGQAGGIAIFTVLSAGPSDSPAGRYSRPHLRSRDKPGVDHRTTDRFSETLQAMLPSDNKKRMRPQPSTFHLPHALAFLLPALTLFLTPNPSSAQTDSAPPIKVESHEVVVPVEMIQETKDPKGIMSDANGNLRAVWILRSNEITNLPPKSVHIFEDGVEQRIRHFSFEKLHAWGVGDNIGRHQEYSCTPRGLWGGPNVMQSNFYFDDSCRAPR
jgi:hypothetical protein